MREIMFKVRFKLYQSTKNEIRHFLLEKYLDSEFISLQKLITFETKLASNSQKDYKLVKVTGTDGNCYFEK